MKICGIICEYNPLHNGHIKQLLESKVKDTTIVCVMSGDFTQRGTPAIADKYVRAKHAVIAGADLVVEMPTVFSTASAENFAFGGIKLLDALKCDTLSFGSECGDISLLNKCAEILVNPPSQLNVAIKSNMASGFSYPSAVSKALISLDSDFAIMDKPNNILGVEYLKQIKLLNSKIKPITILRENNYSSKIFDGEYASSSAIRSNIAHNYDSNLLSKYLPKYVLDDLSAPIYEKYHQFVYSFMNTVTAQYLNGIEGISEGLENRIIANINKGNYDSMIEAIKTKRYTLVKLQRVLLYALLGITKEQLVKAKSIKPYAKVLAVNKNRLDLLTHLARANVSTPGKLNVDQQNIINVDIKASNLYSSLKNEIGNKDLSFPLQKV